jgi:hypothetical protein
MKAVFESAACISIAASLPSPTALVTSPGRTISPQPYIFGSLLRKDLSAWRLALSSRALTGRNEVRGLADAEYCDVRSDLLVVK